MSDKRELLQSMLNNLINDNHSEATVDSHNYFSQKMKEVMAGNKEDKKDDEPKELVTDDID